MKQLAMSPAGIGAVRLHVSPVNQLAGLLRLAASGAWHPEYARVARRALPALASPKAAILRELVPARGVGYLPIVHLRPEVGALTLDEELAAIESLPGSVIEDDLDQAACGGPQLAASREAGTVGRDVAEAVRRLWREVLADDWSHVHDGLRAEVARCAELMATAGVAGALAQLHPKVHWVAEESGASVVLDKPIEGTHDVGPEGLVLMPNAFLWDEPLVTVGARTEGLSYPCRTGERRPVAEGHPMARLIGTTRARVLDALVVPLTTTELSARLEVAPSTVSTHLKVLHTAGLVRRRRDGQRVVYARAAP